MNRSKRQISRKAAASKLPGGGGRFNSLDNSYRLNTLNFTDNNDLESIKVYQMETEIGT